MAEEPAEPEAEDAPAQEPRERGGFLKFWTTLPGVLTGLAAVIAAVVSLVALFGPGAHEPGTVTDSTVTTGTSSGPPSGSASSPASGSSSGQASGPSSGPASGPSSGPASAGVARQGSLTLAVDEFADLTAGTVSSGRTTGSEFLLFGDGSYRLVAAIGQTFALADAADRSACVAALGQRQDRYVLLADVRGQTVCVLLGTQQVAALNVTAAPALGAPRLAFDYVVWD